MRITNEATAAEFAADWKNSSDKYARRNAKARIEAAADMQESLAIRTKSKWPTDSENHLKAAMRLRLEAMTA
jgi:hypothetical protein